MSENLPALVTRAGQRLLDARNSAEVLEAKRLAESALHYAKLTKAANETHADCLRIITRAEIRMADEIDAGQARGEVPIQGQHATHVQGADMTELGISRQRVAEWRETRDAGSEIVEEAIQSALNEGRAPTKSDIAAHVRGTFGTGDNEWFTPPEYIGAAREVLGTIDLDPASHPQAQETVRAGKFFTKSENGLIHPWFGRVWLNPPYAQPYIAEFVAKLCLESRDNRVTAAIMLTHNYSDTAWHHEAASHAAAFCEPRGRIRFIAPDGSLAAPTQGQRFFYFGSDVARFAQIFSRFGLTGKWFDGTEF